MIRKAALICLMLATSIAALATTPPFTHPPGWTDCEYIDCGNGQPCVGCFDQNGDPQTCNYVTGFGWVCGGASSTAPFRSV